MRLDEGNVLAAKMAHVSLHTRRQTISTELVPA